MPVLPQGFSARQVEPIGPSAPQLPVSPKEGWPVVITGSEMVATANNANNGMLVLSLQIIDGEHRGDEGTYRLNLYHDNAKTVEIANRQLSSVCHVTGKIDAKASEELHNIPFRAVVGLQKVAAGAEDKGYTEIKAVLDINGNAPGKSGATIPAAQAPAAPPTPPPAAATGGWQAPAAPPAEAAPAAPAWGTPAANAAAPAAPPWAQKPA